MTKKKTKEKLVKFPKCKEYGIQCVFSANIDVCDMRDVEQALAQAEQMALNKTPAKTQGKIGKD